MSLRALIFDFDGTLAETERDGHRVAYNRAFADLDLAWHWSEEHYGELLAVAGGKERIVHFIRTESPPRPDRLRDEDPSQLAELIHARKALRFAELAGGIPLRPGVARLIAEAKRAGLKLGIATTARESGVRAVLSHAPETLAAFDVIAAGDVVPRKKPAPDIYTFALDALGVASREAVAFEDTALGLEAARAAAIETIVTTSGYSAHESFAGARAVLENLDDPRGPVTLSYLRALVP